MFESFSDCFFQAFFLPERVKFDRWFSCCHMTPGAGALGKRWMMGSADLSLGSSQWQQEQNSAHLILEWMLSFNLSFHLHCMFCSRNSSLLKIAFTQTCIRFFCLSVVTYWTYWTRKCPQFCYRNMRPLSSRFFFQSNMYLFCLLCVSWC